MPELYVEGLVFSQEFDSLDPARDHILEIRAPFFEDSLQVGLLPDELQGTTKENLTLIKLKEQRAIEVFRSDEAAFWIEWSGDGNNRMPVLDKPVDSLIFTESANPCRWLTVCAPSTPELNISRRSQVEGLNFFVNRLVAHCVQRSY